MSDKPLKSLADFNTAQLERYERLKAWSPNGIACPQCAAECVEPAIGGLIKGDPPQWPMKCPSCGWTGTRVCA